MVASDPRELFGFLAKQIEKFLRTHHGEHFETTHRRRRTESGDTGYRDEEIFQLGFTFSFPVEQHGINRGTLLRWTKGFDIPAAVGQDVCALLQREIDALGLPVRVAALVNDTVGTLMARAYTSPGKDRALLGAIFGTGTNGAYVERRAKVTKMDQPADGARESGADTGEMIINCEWGSFDNGLSVLPNTAFDRELDAESNNPGIQMFEKRVSGTSILPPLPFPRSLHSPSPGMFLGEILRRALLALTKSASLFSDVSSGTNELHSTTTIAEDAALYARWGLDTSFLSLVKDDRTPARQIVRQALERDLGVDAASIEDARAVQTLVAAIGRRAARLSAVAIGGVVLASGRLETDDVVDVGVDGSLVEYYPGFEEEMREALREIGGVGEAGEKKIRIGIAKDGSGVGAALIALVAAGRSPVGKPA